MMSWATFFIMAFVLLNLTMSVVDRGGGIASTRLTVAVSEADVAFSVTNTKNFLAASVTHPAYVMIGSKEVIRYTNRGANSLTGITRNVADPQTGQRGGVDSYPIGTKVKTLAVGAMDSFLGYNVTTSGASFGALDALTFGANLFIKLPKFLMWNYSFFQGEWTTIRYILLAFSGGFLWGVAMSMLTLAQSIWG